MIRDFSSGVVKWMEQEGVISVEDKEVFSYAVYSLLFGLLPIFLVTLLGLCFGMLREGLIMITPFMLIRKFSGGYHSNSPKLCIIFSTALLAIAMVFIKITVQGGYTVFLRVLVVLSALCLSKFSPVDNGARKLTDKERQLFRRIVCAFAVISVGGYIFMCRTIPNQYATAFGTGILLAAFLQIVGIVAAERKSA